MTPWVFWGIMVLMPGRNVPLITGQIYHTLNRGVASQPIFLNKKNYQRDLVKNDCGLAGITEEVNLSLPDTKRRWYRFDLAKEPVLEAVTEYRICLKSQPYLGKYPVYWIKDSSSPYKFNLREYAYY